VTYVLTNRHHLNNFILLILFSEKHYLFLLFKKLRNVELWFFDCH
jgi:hypothetical protein